MNGYSVQGGPSATYTRYPDGSLDTIQWSVLAGSFKNRYNLRGQMESITFPSGLLRGFTYDDQGRLGQLSHFDPVAGNLATYAYDYDFNHATSAWDRLGQRTGMRATVPSQSLSNALTKYHYDSLYQLTRVDYPNVAPFNGEVHAWTYDAIGNRLTNTVGAATQTYTYYKVAGNPNNYQRLTSDGVNSYTYDARGNTLTKTGLNFGWTDDNQIWTLSGAATADYRYDYQNRRRSKTVSGQVTTYLYEGLNLIAESGASSADYLFGRGIDEPLAMRRGGQIYYYATDALGSVNLVTNTGGAVQNKYLYDAWGVTRSQTGSLGNAFGYTARETGEAGFLFYRARFHSPATGRFLSEDPVSSSIRNRYPYVSGNPIRWADPLGLWETLPGRPDLYGGSTIVCDGAGGIIPWVSWSYSHHDLSCVFDCVILHEATHVADAYRANPFVCHGKPFGAKVRASSTAEAAASERRAYSASINCLILKQQQDPADAKCCNEPIGRQLDVDWLNFRASQP